jgi:hypothetical protein
MSPHPRRSAVILLSALLTACTSAGERTEGPTWHADVKPLFEQRCNGCHTQGGIAPFRLDDHASAKAFAPAIKSSTAARTMPPWLAAQGCTEYAEDTSLTDAQIAMLGAWADTGAPEGDPATAPAPKSTAPAPASLSRVDLTLPMPSPYAPSRATADDYRCFLIDWPYETDKFVTGFGAKPGNDRIVHHVIAFLITPDKVQTMQDLDAAEAGEGWTCYGAPAPNQRAIAWLGAWAPGGKGSDTPAGTGIRVQPGSKIALQVHYNSLRAGEGDTDLTSIDLKVDDAVEHEAFILPWTNPMWPGTQNMKIPAGAPDTMHQFQFDPSPFIDRLSNGGLPKNTPFDIHQATLHMHTLGTSGSIEIVRKEADPECMLQIDNWNFHWQSPYRFSAPKRFNPGDQLRIECHFDNTAAKQQYSSEPKDVFWGEGTGDEMCLGILYVSKI